MSDYQVLRIGHRLERDKRITTHVALTARAFGASKMYLSNPDSRIVRTVDKVVQKFGGEFIVEPVNSPKKVVSEWVGKVIHLTMFGISMDQNIIKLQNEEVPLLFIVGGKKVPSWLFESSDYNMSVGNQPHSEVSALAVCLSKLYPNSHNHSFEGPFQVVSSPSHRKMVNLSDFE